MFRSDTDNKDVILSGAKDLALDLFSRRDSSPLAQKDTLKRFFLILSVVFLSACETKEMVLQPKKGPLDGSPLFADGRATRPLVQGTVPRGHLRLDKHLYEGKVNNDFAKSFPMPVTEALLKRAQERFNIFCSACHGRTGEGNGMIVQRGMPRPTSLHDPRLRSSPPGYFFDVATHGFGRMYGYGDRVTAEDRWAIAAYIQALQRSQNARMSDVPEAERAALEKK